MMRNDLQNLLIADASYQNATDNLDLISLFILEELT